MSKNYYLIGSFIGLVVAVLVAWNILGSNLFDLSSLQAGQKYFGFLPMLLGILTIVVVALWVDKKNFKISYMKAGLILPEAIFLFGVLVGCSANWAMNGRFDNAFDYFIKPLFWISSIGTPITLVIGSIYFLMRRRLTSTFSRSEF